MQYLPPKTHPSNQLNTYSKKKKSIVNASLTLEYGVVVVFVIPFILLTRQSLQSDALWICEKKSRSAMDIAFIIMYFASSNANQKKWDLWMYGLVAYTPRIQKQIHARHKQFMPMSRFERRDAVIQINTQMIRISLLSWLNVTKILPIVFNRAAKLVRICPTHWKAVLLFISYMQLYNPNEFCMKITCVRIFFFHFFFLHIAGRTRP